MSIEQRLEDLGIVLPEAPAVVANYLPFQKIGNLVIISGQLPMANGESVAYGQLGGEVTLEEGMTAARQCAINILVHIKAACEGDWSRFDRLLRLGGFVNATADFTDHPKVINGASDLMVKVLGDEGRHARAAVGVSSLPLGVAVEIEALVSLKS